MTSQRRCYNKDLIIYGLLLYYGFCSESSSITCRLLIYYKTTDRLAADRLSVEVGVCCPAPCLGRCREENGSVSYILQGLQIIRLLFVLDGARIPWAGQQGVGRKQPGARERERERRPKTEMNICKTVSSVSLNRKLIRSCKATLVRRGGAQRCLD